MISRVPLVPLATLIVTAPRNSVKRIFVPCIISRADLTASICAEGPQGSDIPEIGETSAASDSTTHDSQPSP